MPLEINAQVSAVFNAIGLDNKPFTSRQSAIVVSHNRQGWLVLRFKNGTQYQYRVHLEGILYKNRGQDNIHVEVHPSV